MTGQIQDSTNIKVMTLNCWGLGYGFSKLRRPRMNAIRKYLAESDFDIVVLEEVQTHEDFELFVCLFVYFAIIRSTVRLFKGQQY